jgi:hypothetical protein
MVSYSLSDTKRSILNFDSDSSGPGSRRCEIPCTRFLLSISQLVTQLLLFHHVPYD